MIGAKDTLITLIPLSMYHRIMRRLISHPKFALQIMRGMISRYRKLCPRCGVVGSTFEIHHTDKRGIRTYLCHECRKTFSELYGTIFYRSKVPLDRWLLVILYWAMSTGSISAAEAGRKIGVSHIAAWKMLTKIRGVLSLEASRDLLQYIAEADESWFGKKQNQEIVLGIVQRGRRKLRLFIIPNVKEETLYPHIRNTVVGGSRFFTDGRISYAHTGIRYHHQSVNHSIAEYARGEVHTNTIEQIWGMIKGIIRTIHHGVTKKYRHLYLAQFTFRYENEKSTNLFYKTLSVLFHPTYCYI